MEASGISIQVIKVESISPTSYHLFSTDRLIPSHHSSVSSLQSLPPPSRLQIALPTNISFLTLIRNQHSPHSRQGILRPSRLTFHPTLSSIYLFPLPPYTTQPPWPPGQKPNEAFQECKNPLPASSHSPVSPDQSTKRSKRPKECKEIQGQFLTERWHNKPPRLIHLDPNRTVVCCGKQNVAFLHFSPLGVVRLNACTFLSPLHRPASHTPNPLSRSS